MAKERVSLAHLGQNSKTAVPAPESVTEPPSVAEPGPTAEIWTSPLTGREIASLGTFSARGAQAAEDDCDRGGANR